MEKIKESRPPQKLKNNGDLLSRGLGCNAKIFKKDFLELSYNLVFKSMHHTSELFIFSETHSGPLWGVSRVEHGHLLWC